MPTTVFGRFPRMADPARCLDGARYLLYALQAVLLLYIAFRYHVLEDWIGDNPELDAYALKIDSFRQLIFPPDRFRPANYPLLGALLSLLVRDGFLAGQLISLCSGMAFYVLVGRLVRQLFNRGAELAVLLFLLGSLPLVMASVRVASDMLFWALLTGALLLSLRLAKALPLNRNQLLLLGLLLGAATGVRYTSLFLLLPLGVVLLLGRREAWSPLGCARQAGLVLLGFTVGYLPAALINLWVFGEPFYSENWRNLLFSYYQYRATLGLPVPEGYDTYALRHAARAVLSEELAQHPDLFIGKTAWVLVDYFRVGFARNFLQLDGWRATLVVALGAGGLLAGLLARSRMARAGHGLAVGLVLVFYGLTALSFLISDRLVLLPGALLVAYGWGLLSLFSRGLMLAVLALVTVAHLPAKYEALQAYAARHPVSDGVALARIEALAAASGPDTRVMGTNLFFRKRAEVRYKPIIVPLRLLQDPAAQAEYCDTVAALIAARRPAYVLVGAVSPYGYPTPACPGGFDPRKWDMETVEAGGFTTRIYSARASAQP